MILATAMYLIVNMTHMDGKVETYATSMVYTSLQSCTTSRWNYIWARQAKESFKKIQASCGTDILNIKG